MKLSLNIYYIISSLIGWLLLFSSTLAGPKLFLSNTDLAPEQISYYCFETLACALLTFAVAYIVSIFIEKNINFEKGQILIPNDTLSYIVNEYTEGERGVRNLKRCLEILYTKINLYTLMKPDSKLFDGEETIKVEYPFTITQDIVKKLIKKGEKFKIPFGMYV